MPRYNNDVYSYNLADCTWDYFTCTKRYGTWPFNKRCCNKRFDMCCKMVMKKKKNTRPLYQMPIRTTTKSSTSVSSISHSVTTQRPSPSTTYNPDKIQLSKCTFISLLSMHLHKNVAIIFSVNCLITIETCNSNFYFYG